jgi:chromate transporter
MAEPVAVELTSNSVLDEDEDDLTVYSGETQKPSSFVSRMLEILLAFLPLGFISFGGPQAHIALLHQSFVEKRQWISEAAFTDLFGLASALPGPSSSQMVAALGFIRSGMLGGSFALFCFQIPSAILMAAAGLLMRNESVTKFLMDPPDWFAGLKNGLFAASIALIAVSIWKLGTKNIETKMTKALFITTTILSLLIKAAWTLPVYLFVSGLISYGWLTFLEKRNKRPPNMDAQSDNTLEIIETQDPQVNDIRSENIIETFKSTKNARLGVINIAAFFAILILVIVVRALFPTCINCVIAEVFYRVGAVIYGGGQVVLPMFISELVDTGYMTESAFLYGLTLIQSLPGPLFNLSAFLGAVVGGVPGMIIAWIGIFAPGVMLIFGVYPFWSKLSQQQWMKKVLVGLNAGALGLILSAFFILWVKFPVIYASAALLGGGLVLFYDVATPIAIVISGLFGIVLGVL